MFADFGLPASVQDLTPEQLNKLIALGDAAEKAGTAHLYQDAIGDILPTGMNGFGDFGRSLWSRIVRTPGVIVKRAGTLARQTVQAVKHGNIIKAVGLVSNPVAVAASLTSDNPHLINLARMTMPISVGAISDYRLRRKAAIGYAVAATVAVGVGVAAGAAGGGGLTAGEIASGVSTGAGIAQKIYSTEQMLTKKKSIPSLPTAPQETIPAPAQAGILGMSGPMLPIFLIGGTIIGAIAVFTSKK